MAIPHIIHRLSTHNHTLQTYRESMTGHYYRGSRWSSSVIWSIPIHYSSRSGSQRRWASLLRETQEPHLFSWAKEMPCSIVEWITSKWKQKLGVWGIVSVQELKWVRRIVNQIITIPPQKVTNVNRNTKCRNITYWALLHPVHLRLMPINAMLLENKAAWPVLWGENTLWRHCVSGRQNWQAATDNNIWNKFDVWNSICSDRDGCSIRVKL